MIVVISLALFVGTCSANSVVVRRNILDSGNVSSITAISGLVAALFILKRRVD